jgi:hypothetical protein
VTPGTSPTSFGDSPSEASELRDIQKSAPILYYRTFRTFHRRQLLGLQTKWEGMEEISATKSDIRIAHLRIEAIERKFTIFI